MRFEFFAYRFHFETLTAVYFPAGKPGNIIRGAFGTIFRRHACEPGCEDAGTHRHRPQCAYARIFEPAAIGVLPSGLSDPPRPFVFRAASLDERLLNAGDPFHFDLHIFYSEHPELIHFIEAFRELAESGLGPGRGKARLTSVDQLNLSGERAARVFAGGKFESGRMAAPNSLSLEPAGCKIVRAQVRFITPTELKADGAAVRQPDFGVLFSRARDRVSTLRSLYGAGPLPIDFRGMAERAARVRLTRCDLQWFDTRRRSSRTGQNHPLGGFIGEAEYQGELAEFVPYLRAAHWTGVGRHTVWGNGCLTVE